MPLLTHKPSHINMSRFHTPLRYPGGKAKFAPIIESIIRNNNLISGHYLEPFAGGAGVALYLLINNVCSEIHINDYDEAVYNFWKAMLENTEDFIDKIISTEITMSEWHKQKEILEFPEAHSLLDKGFATFFLNRTNHSGILKGGVIGGQKQAGKYKLDARFNKSNLIKRIERIAKLKDRIHLYNEDAYALLNRCDSFLPQDSLIYLDPPYYEKGQGLYRNFYTHDDHVKIKEAVATLRHKWIISYDNQNEIKEIYKEFRKGYYSLNYSISNRRQAKEIIILGNNVSIPSNTIQFD